MRNPGGAVVVAGVGGSEWIKKSGSTRALIFTGMKDRDLLMKLKQAAMETVVALSQKGKVPDTQWLKGHVIVNPEA